MRSPYGSTWKRVVNRQQERHDLERRLRFLRASAKDYRRRYKQQRADILSNPQGADAWEYVNLGFQFVESLLQYRKARRVAAVLRRMEQYREAGKGLKRIDERAAMQERDRHTPRFTVNQKDLLKALNSIKAGHDGKQKAPDFATHVFIEARDGELLLSMYGEETTVKAEVQRQGKTNVHYKTLVELIRLYSRETLRFQPAHYLRPGTKTVIAMQTDCDRSIFASNMDSYLPWPTMPRVSTAAA